MPFLINILLICVISFPTYGYMGQAPVPSQMGIGKAVPQQPVNYEEIYPQVDERARRAPEFRRIEDLTDFLIAPYGNDEVLKTRAIVAWMVYHLNYDSFKYNNLLGNAPDGKRRQLNSGNIYKTRIGICGDFADLFVEMAHHAGLKAKRIDGIAGYHLTRETFLKSGHAWNAVRIGKKWRLLDVTWAMSGDYTIFDEMKKVSDYKKAVRERRRHTEDLTVPENRFFDNSWFLTDPEEMVKTHFPNDVKLEFLKKPVSQADVIKENEKRKNKQKKHRSSMGLSFK